MLFALDVLRCPRCGGRRQIVGVYPGGPQLRDRLQRWGLDDHLSLAKIIREPSD